jgi:2-C-methyl-D-erythritol 2,4-cyclodiphosphate synthase
MVRTGIGWDVHPLVEGRELWLGCVRFDDAPRGLDGHSDADVVAHAICDALLGAVGLGDIGEHFPPTDDAYKGMGGSKFLEAVRDMVGSAGYSISNIDCVVMSDAVRLGDRKKEMHIVMAAWLGLTPDQVCVKATTWEGFGAVGRGEVVAAQAVATIVTRNQ